jgi:hypothetical protein
MGLLALAVMSGKYSRRQANIERNYQARERVAEKITAENNPPNSRRIEDQQAQRPFATPDNKLIPLWPLATLLSLISIVAATMLYRGRVRLGPPQHESCSP